MGDGADDRTQQRRRQARGERRMSEILDAAARVFAALGYEAATTNKIAAEAGVSPGSLYQFFANKEALAQALADRFVVQMRDAHLAAFESADPGKLPLPEVIDRMVDPIVAFNLANPGFKALFARPDMPPGLAEAARPIQTALLGRVEGAVAARAPALGAAERERVARVLIQIVQAMIPLLTSAEGGERTAIVAELKRAVRGYLQTIEG